MIVRFINRALDRTASGHLMQGMSGKTYGQPSRWDAARQAQSVEWQGSQADYEAALEDISRAWHLANRRWQPVEFVQEAVRPLPLEVAEFLAGYNLAMDGKPLPDLASEAAKAGHKLVVWQMATETHQESPGAGSEPLRDPTLPVDEMKRPAGDQEIAQMVKEGTIPPPVDAKMNWLKLKKIARDEGVSLEGVQGNPAIVEAINAHRKGLIPA